MKQKAIILSVLLILAALAVFFLPSTTFSIQESAVQKAEENIMKLQGRLEDAQAKYDEMKAAGDSEDKLKKQQGRVDKAQDNLAAGLVDQEKVLAEAEGPQKSLSLFEAGLPEGLEVNRIIINENNNIYKDAAILSQFSMLRWLALGFLGLALLFTLSALRGSSTRSLTLSALLELLALALILIIILRQGAIPVKAPYNNPSVSFLAWLPAILLLVSVFLKAISAVKVKRSLIYIFAILLSLLSIFPFYIMIINATRDTYQIQQGLSLLPGNAFLNNWSILMGKNFDVALGLRNSAIIAFGSTILSVYFSSLAAYGLTVYDFKGRKALFSFIVGIIMIPTQVSGIGFYMYMYRIGWVDSFLPLILPAIAAPATVFFMRQYLQANFQISLVEAARIDGAGELYSFNKIVMPIMLPAMATMGIFSVITSWNNYLTPLMLLKNPEMATLPMMVRTLRGDIYRTEYGSIYLGLTLTAAPLLIVYFSLSKYIIQGVALGGVKE